MLKVDDLFSRPQVFTVTTNAQNTLQQHFQLGASALKTMAQWRNGQFKPAYSQQQSTRSSATAEMVECEICLLTSALNHIDRQHVPADCKGIDVYC